MIEVNTKSMEQRVLEQFAKKTAEQQRQINLLAVSGSKMIRLEKKRNQLIALLNKVDLQLSTLMQAVGMEVEPMVDVVGENKNKKGTGVRGRRRTMPRLTVHFNDGQNYEMNPVGSKLTLAKAMLENNDITFSVDDNNKIIVHHPTFGRFMFKSPTSTNFSGLKMITVKKY